MRISFVAGLLLALSVLVAYQYPELPMMIRQAIETLERDPDMAPASWGVAVIDIKTGEVLVNHNGQKALTPASTLKVLTTASALEVLGPNFRYRTLLEYDGNLSNGVLTGNIYVRGSGDPTLGSDRFAGCDRQSLLNTWLSAIKTAGIVRIDGNIIGDASAFTTDNTPAHWMWEDMGNYYGAGASGLNFCENSYELVLSSGATGSPVTLVSTNPDLEDIDFVMEARAGKPGSGDNAYIYGAPYTGTRYVRGTIPPNRRTFSIRGSMPEPAYTCAHSLFHQLLDAGIPVSGCASSQRREQHRSPDACKLPRTTLHTHQSPYLTDIIRATNYYSINLYAECLLNTLGGWTTRPDDPLASNRIAGLGAIRSYWQKKGISVAGLNITDGSGLSPDNAVRPLFLAETLCDVRLGLNGDYFWESLPLGGKEGTVRSFCDGTALAGKVRVKSGFISGVRAYAGYAPTASGREVAFVLIANRFDSGPNEMKTKLEQLLVSVTQAL